MFDIRLKEYFEAINAFNIKIKKKMILSFEFSYKRKIFSIEHFNEHDLDNVYIFFNKFSPLEKDYFPFPIFKPKEIKLSQFKENYFQYLNEKDSWVYFLIKYKSRIIGMTLIKKIGFKNLINEENKSPTTGIFIDPAFRQANLGSLLQKLSLIQSYLLGLKKIYIRISSQNTNSIKLYKKLGFINTNNSYKVIRENRVIFDEEFVLNLSDMK